MSTLAHLQQLAVRVASAPSSATLDRFIEGLDACDSFTRGEGPVAVQILSSLCDALALPPYVAALGAVPIPSLPQPEVLIEMHNVCMPLGTSRLAPALDDPMRHGSSPSATCQGSDDAVAPGPALEGAALTWTLVASDVLRALGKAIRCFHCILQTQLPQGGSELGQFPLSFLAQVVVSATHFASYAPWSTPNTQAASADVLSAIWQWRLAFHTTAITGSVDVSASCVTADRALQACLHGCDTLADATLDLCEALAAGSKWHTSPRLAHMRHTLAAVVAALDSRALTNATRVGTALVLAFRLCDDSTSVTSVWLGTSCIAHVLRTAPVTLLRLSGHAQLLNEVLRRASDCRHPTVIGTAGLAQQLARTVLWGPAPALPVARGGTALPHVFLEGPYDDALVAALRALAVAAASPDRQYALITGVLMPLLTDLGPYAARHAANIVSTLSAVVHDAGDAKVAIAGLAAMRILVSATPSCFDLCTVDNDFALGGRAHCEIQLTDSERAIAEHAVLADEKDDSLQLDLGPLLRKSAQSLIDHVVAATVVALVQADAGLAVLQCTITHVFNSCDTSGVTSGRDAVALVRQSATALMRALAQCSPTTGMYASCRALRLADELERMLV